MHPGQVGLRERLQGLMLFRAILVTFFLGSTLAAGVSTLDSFSSPHNLVLLVLIVGTYVLTIVYGLLLERRANLAALARTQLVGDLLVVALLVVITGLLESPFIFLFFLTVIAAAIVQGRRAALLQAAGTTLSLFVLAALSLGVVAVPVLEVGLVARPFKVVMFEVVFNSAGALLIAILSGTLVTRLGEANVAIAQQRVDIEELRALNHNILASLSSGLLTIDLQGRIIFFNKAAEQISGLAQGDILGRPLPDVFPGIAEILAGADAASTVPPKARAGTTRAGTTGEARFEHIYQHPDGRSAILGFSVSTLRTAGGEDSGRIVIFQDLTDLRKLEHQMKRAERLAAVGELSAAIAHEIRNPLASISGSVEMLQSLSDVSDDESMLMAIVIREVERLNELISDFLAYCSPRPPRFTETDLRLLLEDVLTLFRNRRGDANLEVELVAEDADLAPALVDPEALHQIVWNLLNNAAEAMGDREATGDGEAKGDTGPQRIRVELDRRGPPSRPAWAIAVEDDGPGIPPEHAQRIFEPFFTTKPSGSGLGLATIYRLIEEHGGMIHVERPKILGGARIEIELPVQQAAMMHRVIHDHDPRHGHDHAHDHDSEPAAAALEA